MLTHAHHKKMLRDILGLNDDVVQHFDSGGTVLTGPTAGGSSTPGVTSGFGNLGSVPTSISSHLPDSVQSGLGQIQDLSPLSAIQSSTQDNFVAQAPQLQQGTNAAQLNNAYEQAQGGISAQQDLVNALKTQNGISNQNSLYGQGQNLLNQQGAANGVGNQSAAAQGFSNIANGTGPNVARSQLNEATGKNVANQAALQAGQRGASNNVGLMARQIAQQGGNLQQNAAGQAATLEAQQQQAALANLGNLGSTQVGQQQAQQNNLANLATNQVNALGQATTGLNTASQNEQNILQGSNNAFNAANVASQGNLNTVNAGISQGNQAASNNLMGGIMNGVGGGLSSLSSLFAKGGEVTEAHQILAKALQKRKVPKHLEHMAKIYHPNMFADGGEADSEPTEMNPPSIDDSGADAGRSGEVDSDLGSSGYTAPEASTSNAGGAYSSLNEGNPFANITGGGGGGKSGGGGGGAGGLMSLAALMADGGSVNLGGANYTAASSSPSVSSASYSPLNEGNPFAPPPNKDDKKKKDGEAGEDDSVETKDSPEHPGQRMVVNSKDQMGGAAGFKSGGLIPGKPKVNHNSFGNDVVPAMLTPKEIVLPLSVTQSANPGEAAKAFVERIKGQSSDDKFKQALRDHVKNRKSKKK